MSALQKIHQQKVISRVDKNSFVAAAAFCIDLDAASEAKKWAAIKTQANTDQIFVPPVSDQILCPLFLFTFFRLLFLTRFGTPCF